jgi:hypothetical protein
LSSPNTTAKTYAAYIKRYGLSWRFHGMGGVSLSCRPLLRLLTTAGQFDLRLMTLDPKALTHILNSPIYEKPLMTRRLMAELIGDGIFGMEGDWIPTKSLLVYSCCFPSSGEQHKRMVRDIAS